MASALPTQPPRLPVCLRAECSFWQSDTENSVSWPLPVRNCELVLILMLQCEFLYHPLHHRIFSPISCSFLLPSGQHHRIPKALREEKVHKILYSLPLSISL